MCRRYSPGDQWWFEKNYPSHNETQAHCFGIKWGMVLFLLFNNIMQFRVYVTGIITVVVLMVWKCIMATLYTSAVDFLVKFKGKDHSTQFIFLILT